MRDCCRVPGRCAARPAAEAMTLRGWAVSPAVARAHGGRLPGCGWGSLAAGGCCVGGGCRAAWGCPAALGYPAAGGCPCGGGQLHAPCSPRACLRLCAQQGWQSGAGEGPLRSCPFCPPAIAAGGRCRSACCAVPQHAPATPCSKYGAHVSCGTRSGWHPACKLDFMHIDVHDLRCSRSTIACAMRWPSHTEAVPGCCLGRVAPTTGAVTPGALLGAHFIIATPAALPAIALSISVPAAVPLLVLVLALLLTCRRQGSVLKSPWCIVWQKNSCPNLAQLHLPKSD